MKYIRKLSRRGEFGSVHIPISVTRDLGKVDFLEILYDPAHKTLVLTPYKE